MFAASGSVEVVIANAGMGTSNPIRKVTLEDWNRMIATNLTGVFLTFRESLAQLPDGWGRLIAIASTAGLHGGPYIAAYAASKHGVVGLMRSLAKEVAKKNITVNAICPTYLDSEMTERTLSNIVSTTGKSAQEAADMLTAANPQGRLVTLAEVSAMALWLCSDGAAAVNGQALALNGGEF